MTMIGHLTLSWDGVGDMSGIYPFHSKHEGDNRCWARKSPLLGRQLSIKMNIVIIMVTILK